MTINCNAKRQPKVRTDERSRYRCTDRIGLHRTLGLALGVLEGTLCLSLQIAGSSLNLQR